MLLVPMYILYTGRYILHPIVFVCLEVFSVTLDNSNISTIIKIYHLKLWDSLSLFIICFPTYHVLIHDKFSLFSRSFFPIFEILSQLHIFSSTFH